MAHAVAAVGALQSSRLAPAAGGEGGPGIQAPRNTTAAGRIHLQTRASKMVKYQEIKVQEQQDQVCGRRPGLGSDAFQNLLNAYFEVALRLLSNDDMCSTY